MDYIFKILHLLDILHQIIVDLFFSHFGLASPELIGVKFCHKQTDRQIFDSVYGVNVPFLNEICYLPTHFARRGITRECALLVWPDSSLKLHRVLIDLNYFFQKFRIQG